MRTKSFENIFKDLDYVLSDAPPSSAPPPGSFRKLAAAVQALAIHVEHHERRLDVPGQAPLRCRYTDCAEGHPQASRGEQITCSTCRMALGLPELQPIDGGVAELQKEISRLQDELRDRGAARDAARALVADLEERLAAALRQAEQFENDASAGDQDGYSPRPTPGCYRMRRLPTADEQLCDDGGDE